MKHDFDENYCLEDYNPSWTTTDSDSESMRSFFGLAIRDAERAHTGVGLWDCAFKDFDDQARKDILAETCWNEPSTNFYKEKMTIVREKTSNRPVAAACGFCYPDYSLTKSKPAMSRSIMKLFPQFSEEESIKVWKNLDFLDDCFPDYDYDNSWMVECVYTDPNHRGKGIATKLVSHILEKGKSLGYNKALITCAIGNEGARHVYEKCGFYVVGQGENSEAMEKIGSPGFYLLRSDL
jgi:GNAT superfamily N-acetyltransferase